MKTEKAFFFCSQRLLQNIDELKEIDLCLSHVPWKEDFVIEYGKKRYAYQTGYNKAFQIEFRKYGWKLYPLLYDNPRLIGDFQKGDIFVEVQFGNSSTLYRDTTSFIMA